MKNRLIITISDINGTKSYNIHQFLRKFIIIILVIIVFALGGSFLFISYLNSGIQKVKDAKAYQLEELENLYALQIENKVKNIEELASKLEDIYSIIGVENDATEDEISENTLKFIDLNKKNFTLKVIPNGQPLADISISSGFGYRKNPITNRNQFHRGIDIPAPMKTPIHSTADGIVEFVEPSNTGDYGRVIKIVHNYGFKTIYAHMSKTYLSVGDIVKKGEVIGLVGNSGRSTAPHLHYEVKYINKILNPKNFMNWEFTNFEQIFKKERKVEWESLVSLINDHQQIPRQ
ncbi:M23 family metallopeptidase [bacterium]|jgi:murein DD-endopeptidase MepM/ murein hydrolase activator NlpD|nr:M23 family metallopeptidase [bacterium]